MSYIRQLFIPSLLIFSQQNIFGKADPIPAPEAAPIADSSLAILKPEAIAIEGRAPDPFPNPKAEAVAQGNYYAFSGAVYIVNGNGGTLNAASPAYCPNNAPVGCGNIGIWNWCCTSGTTCQWPSATDHSVVGCCPNGQTCNGAVNGAISTVTVYISTTIYAPNNVVTTVIGGGGAFIASTTKTVQYNGYCSTLIANGPGLPTTGAGTCGTILIVNEAGVRTVGREIFIGLGLFYGFLGLVWGFFGRGRW